MPEISWTEYERLKLERDIQEIVRMERFFYDEVLEKDSIFLLVPESPVEDSPGEEAP